MRMSEGSWKIEFSKEALYDLKKLDKFTQKRIIKYLTDKVATQEDPRKLGRPLGNKLKHLWRYKVAKDYRVLCKILDDTLTILIVAAGHRKDVYRIRRVA